MRKPKIRDSVYVCCRDNDTLFFFTTTRKAKGYRLNNLAQRLLTLLNGERSVEEILVLMRVEEGYKGDENVLNAISFLERENIIEDADALPPVDWFSPVEVERYERQFNFFSEFAIKGTDKYHYQKQLKDKKVAVIGLGGAGSWIIYSLILAGVGRLLIVDHDRVEWSNLNRHAMYEEPDVGQYKTKVVLQKAKAINSKVEIEAVTTKITKAADLELLLKGCHLVINTSDEPNASLTHEWVSEACVRLCLPHILGGGYNCKIGALGFTVIPFHTACWVCIKNQFNAKEDPFMRRWSPPYNFGGIDRLVGASLGAVLGIVGNFHALEALRILTGFAPPQWCNRGRYLDFLSDEIHEREVSRDLHCSLCGSKNGSSSLRGDLMEHIKVPSEADSAELHPERNLYAITKEP